MKYYCIGNSIGLIDWSSANLDRLPVSQDRLVAAFEGSSQFIVFKTLDEARLIRLLKLNMDISQIAPVLLKDKKIEPPVRDCGIYEIEVDSDIEFKRLQDVSLDNFGAELNGLMSGLLLTILVTGMVDLADLPVVEFSRQSRQSLNPRMLSAQYFPLDDEPEIGAQVTPRLISRFKEFETIHERLGAASTSSVSYPPVNSMRRVNPAAQTLLYQACRELDFVKARDAIQQGANVNEQARHSLLDTGLPGGDEFHSPLSLVAMIPGKTGDDRQQQLTGLLLNHGADVDQPDRGGKALSPLMWAIFNNNESLCQVLIHHAYEHKKALVNLPNKAKAGVIGADSPLLVAIKSGSFYRRNETIATPLIHAGADVNVVDRHQQTPLHWACIFRNSRIINVLLQYGANVNAVNAYGHTPADYYHYPIKLIDIAPDRPDGNIANMTEFSDLHACLYQWPLDSLIRRIKHRNNISIDEDLSQTLRAGNVSTPTLEERHKNLFEESFDKIQAMHIQSDYKSAIDTIVQECREETRLQEMNESPLGFAVKMNDKNAIELHLKNPSLINRQDKDGFTALHWAAMFRNNEKIKLLIAHGADSSIQNTLGRTPVDYYHYQIRGKDFSMVSLDESKRYQFKCLAPGAKLMPEFRKAFCYEETQRAAAAIRNNKPVDPGLFVAPIFSMSTELVEPLCSSEQPGSSCDVEKPSPVLTHGFFSLTDDVFDAEKTGYQVTKNTKLAFTNKAEPSLGVLMSFYFEGVETSSLWVREDMQQNILSRINSPEQLIIYLQSKGEVSQKIAQLIETDINRTQLQATSASICSSSDDTSQRPGM